MVSKPSVNSVILACEYGIWDGRFRTLFGCIVGGMTGWMVGTWPVFLRRRWEALPAVESSGLMFGSMIRLVLFLSQR